MHCPQLPRQDPGPPELSALPLSDSQRWDRARPYAVTIKLGNYAWVRTRPKEAGRSLLTILTCKSMVGPGYMSKWLKPFNNWFVPSQIILRLAGIYRMKSSVTLLRDRLEALGSKRPEFILEYSMGGNAALLRFISSQSRISIPELWTVAPLGIPKGITSSTSSINMLNPFL